MNDPAVNAIKDQLRLKKDTAFSSSYLGKAMALLLDRVDMLYEGLHYQYRVAYNKKCEMYEIPFAQCNCGFENAYKLMLNG